MSCLLPVCHRAVVLALLFLALLPAVLPAPGLADADTSLRNARGLCSVFEEAGFAAASCQVSEPRRTVDLRIATVPLGAVILCAGIGRMIADHDIVFDAGWRVRIYGPSSAAILTHCPL